MGIEYFKTLILYWYIFPTRAIDGSVFQLVKVKINGQTNDWQYQHTLLLVNISNITGIDGYQLKVLQEAYCAKRHVAYQIALSELYRLSTLNILIKQSLRKKPVKIQVVKHP